MKFSIKEKAKKDMFISLFQVLKNCTSLINMMFQEDYLYIQGMDKAHVCLFDLKIMSTWFESYEKKAGDSGTACIDSHIFHQILSFTQEKDTIVFEYDLNEDNTSIQLLNTENIKGEFNKFFKLPLTDMECDLLAIPEVEYDVEFSIKAKKMNEIVSQLAIFGDTIQIETCDKEIKMSSDGVTGNMIVSIPIDDLNDYAVTEGETVNVCFSLNYIQKMCLTTKLSTEIEFFICKEYPMKIKYDLGENSTFMFYLAPKMED
jgi:proliferating cell nuclear antigen PCNA